MTSIIMISSGSISSPSGVAPAPESSACSGFYFLVPEGLTPFIDQSVISSQKTPEGIGKP
jgi:hypothetical protein